MNVMQHLALLVPAVRRLRNARDLLLQERDTRITIQQRLEAELELAQTPSPFFHYNASFDPEEVIRRHAVLNLVPTSGYLTNFLGVMIDPKYSPAILGECAGTVEGIPIPSNWHADIAEWGAALRAVDLARETFTVLELGCGWGCWLNNTGVAARRAGLDVQLIGIEGDRGHIRFAEEATEANGFEASQRVLYHGIAAASSGVALFPQQEEAGVAWGLEPIFGATEQQQREALESGKFVKLPMVALADVVEPRSRIDLLHVDIQGGEADLVADAIDLLFDKVAYLVIGTHSRQIEGRLFDILLERGWKLEIERPAILSLNDPAIPVVVDGVQGWRNPALLPG